MRTGISIYFYAGDFVEAARRYKEGRTQTYATHDEVIRTCLEISAAGVRVDIYSFMTPVIRETWIADGVRVIDIGATHYADKRLLKCFRRDSNDSVIAHFPHLKFLRAVKRSGKKAMAVLASSYNGRGIRTALHRRCLTSLLNQNRFDFVANHCGPSTEQLRSMGVSTEKLLAWNIPLRYAPSAFAPKLRTVSVEFGLCYVGGVTEAKGAGDLVRAVAHLHRAGHPIRLTVAGGGDIDAMRALAGSLGAGDAIEFIGTIGNEDAFALMRASDAVVVPSRHEFPEGFPLTLFEAIASRTPVICSDHPMFRAVLADRVNAMVFRAGDHLALAESVRALASDHLIYQTLSKAATDTWGALQGSADWSTMVKQWALLGKDSPYLRRNTLAALASGVTHGGSGEADPALTPEPAVATAA